MAKQDIIVDTDFNGNSLLDKGVESIDNSAVLSSPSISGTVNNYNPAGLSSASVLRANGSALPTITGILSPGFNKVLWFLNIGNQPIVLKNQNSGSLPDNRFAINSDVTVGVDRCAILFYDTLSNRWRVISIS